MYLALALLILVAIACGSPEPVEPTPTPDVPLFAEGEAVALVRADMIGKNTDLAERGGCDESIRNAIDDVMYGDSTTTASYLGQQVWSVTGGTTVESMTSVTTLEWKVYECSGVVEPANDLTGFTMIWGC